VELLYKPYHDRGVFEIKVGGKVIQTVDAFAPVLRLIWWTAVTLPADAEATIAAAGKSRRGTRPASTPSFSWWVCRSSLWVKAKTFSPRKMEDNNAEHLKWGIDLSNDFSVQ
jgi:hypothetical protein